MANLIWRFYMDSRNRLRWQRLSILKDVISESMNSYNNYQDCLDDAQVSGYVFYPSQGKIPSTLYLQTYARVAKQSLTSVCT